MAEEMENIQKETIETASVLSTVIPLIETGTAAYNSYKVAAEAAAVAQGLLNGAISLNPVGLVAAGAVVAGAAIYGLYEAVTAETEAEKVHRIALEENNAAIQERTKSLEESQKAFSEEILNSKASYDHTKALADELFNLADASGNVAETDRARAEFILGELNNALGTEYDMVDGQIKKYGELQDSIYDTIEARKAESYLNVYRDEYEAALQREKEDREELTKQQAMMNDVLLQEASLQEEIMAKKEELAAKEQELNNADSESERQKILSEYLKIEGVIQDREGRLENLYKDNKEDFEALAAAESALQSTTETITGYETIVARVNEQDYAGAIAAVEEFAEATSDSEILSQEFAEGSTEKLGQLGFLYQDSMNGLIAALKAYEDEPSQITAAAVEKAVQEVSKRQSDYIEAGGTIKDGIITGYDGVNFGVGQDISLLLADLKDLTPSLKAAAGDLGVEGVSGFSESHDEWVAAAKNSVDGIVTNLNSEDSRTRVWQACYALGQYSVMAYNAGQDASSPAKEFIKASENSIAGIVKGVEDNKSEVRKVFEELAEETAKASFERKLQFAKTGEEIWKLKQQEVNGLLESEKEYLAEKRRIELEQEEQEYREKLENAKNAEARQKIIAERQKELKRQEQDAYLEILKEGAEEQKKILDACQKEAEEKKEQFIDDLEEIKDAQKDFYNDLDAGGLLETVTTTLGGDEYEVEGLRDWELENKALKNYSELLDKVSGRLKEGFGEDTEGYDEFMDEIRQNHKGDGGKFLAYLDMADDSELFRYISGYQENKKLREGISKDSFSEETSQLIDEFKKEWGKVPEEFFNIGDESAKNYGEGFRNSLYDILEEAISEIEYSFQSLSPTLTLVIGNGALGGGNAVTYNSTYNVIPSSGESTREQLAVIRTEETLREMRAKGGAVV